MRVLNTDFIGQTGIEPRIIKLKTTDSYATVTTAGYLNQFKALGYSFNANDLLAMSYGAGTSQLFSLSIDSDGIITIVPPVNAGNVIAGGNGIAGYLASFPATASKGSLRVTAVANTGNTVTTVSNAAMGQASTISIPDPGAATSNFVLDSQALAHTILNTTGAGKTVRLNVRTESTDTANSLIGAQIKPGRGVSAATDVIGAEISPRLNDAIALTGSASVIGLHVDTYLKGATGNIAGDVRGQQIEMVDDGSSSRTVAGNVTHLRMRSNISYTVTGKYSVMRVENEEGTKALDALYQFTTGVGCLVEANGTVGGTQDQAIKILIGTTTYYVPLYTTVS